MRSGKKLYYKIGEVGKIFQIPAHVLRYWEGEFSLLKPAKNRVGQRIYRQKDLDLIGSIRGLLYDEGYTISGARRRLKESVGAKENSVSPPTKQPMPDKVLREVKKELQAILTLLDSKPVQRQSD